MASVTSAASDKTNGIVDKPGVEKPKTRPDVEDGEEGAGEEDEDDEEDEYEEADDEDDRQMAEDDDDDEDDHDEEGEDQDKPQSFTHYLLGDPEGPEDNDNEQDEEDTEDVYIPPVPEPISRKRSHQEVAEDEEEPDSKKAKA